AMYSLGELTQQGNALIALGELDICLGNYDRAQRRLDQYVQLMGTATSTALFDIGHTLALGLLAYHTEDHEQALIHAMRSWQTAYTLSSRTRQAKALMIMGHAHFGLQQPIEAAKAYEQALALYTELGKAPSVAEAKAGLAAVAFTQGEGAQALQYVEEILPMLTAYAQIGVDEPFYTYLTCYTILIAQHDVRAATVLQTAHRLLQTYAENIQDDHLRHSFLENVAVHRALHHAYTSQGDTARR
ncbi:MAG: tetratricopeptide repeat protein, partial [Chloroflexota bacterium]|nr:tetratricopeptide repeat protein [Chloroflexota bacterium]